VGRCSWRKVPLDSSDSSLPWRLLKMETAQFVRKSEGSFHGINGRERAAQLDLVARASSPHIRNFLMRPYPDMLDARSDHHLSVPEGRCTDVGVAVSPVRANGVVTPAVRAWRKDPTNHVRDARWRGSGCPEERRGCGNVDVRGAEYLVCWLTNTAPLG